MKPIIEVAVCIVSFRNAGDVRCCLTALSRSTYRNFHVYVCENGGADAERDIAETLATLALDGISITQLSARDNPGFAAGVNRCIAASPDADIWWILNPDCMPDQHALTRMVARFETNEPRAVGGTIHHPAGWVQAYGGGRWGPWSSRVVAFGYGQSLAEPVDAGKWEHKLDYLSGASFAINRAFVDAVGLMREDYFLYCEEIEYFQRAKRSSASIAFASDARIAHLQGTATGSGGPMRSRGKLPIYMDQRNRILLTRDTRPGRLPVAALLLFAQYPLIFGRRLAFRQWGYALQGWWAGILDERGKPGWFGR